MKKETITIKQRLSKYFKIEKELQKIQTIKTQLLTKQEELFCSHLKTIFINADAQCVLNYLFQNPKTVFGRGWLVYKILSGNFGIYGSNKDLNKNIGKILKKFTKLKLLVKVKHD